MRMTTWWTVELVVRCGGDEFVDDVKADVLDAVVGVKSQPEIAAGGLDQRRLTTAAETTDDRRVAERTVDDLQVVVGAVFRRLDVKIAAEVQSYPVTRRRYNNVTTSWPGNASVCPSYSVIVTHAQSVLPRLQLRRDCDSTTLRFPFVEWETHEIRTLVVVVVLYLLCKIVFEVQHQEIFFLNNTHQVKN